MAGISTTIYIHDAFSSALSRLSSGLSHAQSGFSSLKSAMSAGNSKFDDATSGSRGLWKSFAVGQIASNALSKGMQLVSSNMGSAIDRFDTLQKYPVVMKSLGYRTKDVAKSSKILSDGIDGLPTTLEGITSMSQQLGPLVGSATKASKTAIALNNAFLASGASTADASRGLTQYTQMLSTGKVDLQSYRTLQETMPTALNAVAKSFGYTGKKAQTDLYEGLKKGKVSTDQLNDAFIKLNKGQQGFAKLARENSAGIRTSLTNLRNAVSKNLANIITDVDKAFAKNGLGSIAKQLNNLKYGINDTFKKISPTVTSLASKAIKGFNQVKPVLSSIFKQFGGAGKAAFSGIKSLFSGFSFGNTFKNLFSGVKNAVSNLNLAEIVKNAFAGIKSAISSFSSGFNATGGLENFKNSLKSIANSISDIFQQLKGTAEKVDLNSLFSKLGTATGNGLNAVSNIISKISEALNNIDTSKLSGFADAVNNISSDNLLKAGSALAGLKVANTVGPGLMSAAKGLRELGLAAKDVASAPINSIQNLFGAMRAQQPPKMNLSAYLKQANNAQKTMQQATAATQPSKLSMPNYSNWQNSASQGLQAAATAVNIPNYSATTTKIGNMFNNMKQAVIKGANGVKGAFSTAKAIISTGFQAIGTGIKYLATGNISGIFNGIKTAISGVVNALSPLGVAVAAITAIIAGAVMAWQSNFLNFRTVMTSIFSNIGDILAPLKTTFNDLKNAFSNLGDILAPVKSAFSSVLKVIGVGAIAGIVAGVALLIDTFRMFAGIASSVVNAVAAVANGFRALKSALTGDFSGATKSLNAAKDSIKGIGDSLSHGFSFSTIRSVTSELSKLGTVTQQAKSKASGGINIKAKADTSEAESKLNSFKTKTVDTKVKASVDKTSFTDPFKGIFSQKQATVPVKTKIDAANVNQQLAQISNKQTTAKVTPKVNTEAVNSQLSAISNKQINPKVAPKVNTENVNAQLSAISNKQVIPKVTPKVNMATANAQITALGARTVSGPKFMPTINLASVNAQLATLTARVIPAPRVSPPNMSGVVSAVASGMAAAASAAQAGAGALSAAASAAVAGMVSAFQSLSGQLSAAVSAAVGAAVAAAQAGAGAMQAAGAAIGAGLASGMQSQVGAVSAAADALVAAANKAARAKAQIHSPSKLFAEIGNYMTQGLVNGMTGSLGSVASASASLSSASLSSFSGSGYQPYQPSSTATPSNVDRSVQVNIGSGAITIQSTGNVNYDVDLLLQQLEDKILEQADKAL